MNKLVRAAIAGAVLSVGAAAPALADIVLPSTGASGGVLSIWDSVGQRSLAVTLNVGYNELQPGILNQEAGYSISNAINSSDVAEVAAFIGGGGNLTWWVTAADSQGGAFSGKGFMTTGVSGLTTLSVTNTAVNQVANAANTFFTNVNTACGTDSTCAADQASGSSAYAGLATWGARYGNNVAAGLGNGTGIGTAQAFYLITSSSNTGGQQANRTAYANSLGAGLWNLTADGTLSYQLAGVVGGTPVPLPAAVWLLGSSLLGFAAVRRRREEKGDAVAA